MRTRTKVDEVAEKSIRDAIEELVKTHGFEAVRLTWNHYGNATKEKRKILREKKDLEDRLAVIEKKLK